MQPRTVSVRGQAIRGKTGSFESLRAQTLTLGKALKRVVAEKVNVSDLTIGSSAANGLMNIISKGDNQGEIVMLPKWSAPVGGPAPQLTFYNADQKSHGTLDPDSSYKVDLSQNLQVQGNVYVGDGGNNYNGYKTLFCKAVAFRSGIGSLKTAADALLGSITTNTTAISNGTQAGLATTTSGSGSGAVLTIVATGTTAVTGVTVTTQGTGYKAGDTLTVAAANIQGSATDLVITLTSNDLDSSIVDTRLSHQNGVLSISGDGSNNGTLTSDDRLKHNETDIKNAVATLAKLQPVVYDKTETFLPADFKGPLDAKATPYRKESGFIAQDVQKIPELQHLVTAGSSSIAYTLDYHGLLAYMVKASQEMASEIKSLKAQVQELKSA